MSNQRLRNVSALLACALAVAPHALNGQSVTWGRFSVEPRIGAAFPTGDFGNVDPNCPPGTEGCDYPLQIGSETGWAWDLRVQAALNERWAAVAGFGKANLDCSGAFCGFGPKPGTKTVSLGIRWIALPIGRMGVWAETGGVVEEVGVIRTEDLEGNPNPSRVWYPWSLGWYGGLGAELPFTTDRRFFFTPGLRFRYVPADPPDSDPDMSPVTATYLLAEVGFRVLLSRN